MIAVNIGVILASLLFMKRTAKSVRVESMSEDEIGAEIPEFCVAGIPSGVRVCSIDGPFFFGAAETFEGTLAGLKEDTQALIVRLGRVPFIDATTLHLFREMISAFEKRRARIIICETNERVSGKLSQAHIVEMLGAENVLPRSAVGVTCR